MSAKRSRSVAVLDDAKFYVLGGYDGENTRDTCEYLDLPSEKWVAMPPLTRPREQHAAGVFIHA